MYYFTAHTYKHNDSVKKKRRTNKPKQKPTETIVLLHKFNQNQIV